MRPRNEPRPVVGTILFFPPLIATEFFPFLIGFASSPLSLDFHSPIQIFLERLPRAGHGTDAEVLIKKKDPSTSFTRLNPDLGSPNGLDYTPVSKKERGFTLCYVKYVVKHTQKLEINRPFSYCLGRPLSPALRPYHVAVNTPKNEENRGL